MKSADANTQLDSAPTATHGVDERTPTPERSSQSKAVPQFTPAERVARGKAARAELPRSAHAAWEPAPMRREMTSFAEVYADQNDRDYRALRETVAAGRVAAELGV